MVPGAMGQLAPGQSAMGLGGGQAMDFYRNEMQNGLNPQFATNAQNQLQQQFGTSVSDILGRAAPGQNTGAMMAGRAEPAAHQLGELGRPAGRREPAACIAESRRFQGLVGTGQAIDQNTLQRIMRSVPNGRWLGPAKMQMLMGGAQMPATATTNRRSGTSAKAPAWGCRHCKAPRIWVSWASAWISSA